MKHKFFKAAGILSRYANLKQIEAEREIFEEALLERHQPNQDTTVKFEVDKEIQDWTREHVAKCKSKAFDGAQFKYEFIPTAIVEVQTVKCMCCKKEKTVYIG